MNREWAHIKNSVNREFIAAESLVLIDRGLSARQAIKKVVEKLGVSDWKIHSAVHALVFETLRARNILDRIIKEALNYKSLKDLNLFIAALAAALQSLRGVASVSSNSITS